MLNYVVDVPYMKLFWPAKASTWWSLNAICVVAISPFSVP